MSRQEGRDGTDVGLVVLEAAPDALTVFSLAVLPEVRLYTSDRMARNIAIYCQAGFVEVGRRPNELRPGWVLVDMAKRL